METFFYINTLYTKYDNYYLKGTVMFLKDKNLNGFYDIIYIK